ncbi:MAG: DcrB-related protein [Clostridia bacterium]|nr:DcrB-related protein [Clostridia bacterium]
MKKLTALILALVLCAAALVSCSGGEEVPDGMKLASVDGEPFKLYVPEDMSLNSGSGLSSAFSYVPDKLVISARYYTPPSEMTLDEYMTYCAEGYADTLEGFEIKSLDAAVLSGADAKKLTYAALIDSVSYTCVQISALHKGDMVSLNMYIPESTFDAYSEMAESVVTEFVLCDKAEPKNDEVTDKNTPAGMKIASDDVLEYRLYVPTSWICYSESGKAEAYYPESEKSNVTVTSYSPDESMSVSDYIAKCEEEYAETIRGYELVEKTDATVAGKPAIAMTFKASYDGVDFMIKQVSLVYSERVYSITYTAVSEKFDEHLADADKMISEFTFR